MHEVLISYSTKDKKWADAACSVLEARGIRCWIAPRDIIPGTEWGAAIIAGIDACKVMVLIFSASANESPQVRREVERAISKGLAVLPCRVEDVKPAGAMEYALGNTHWLDVFTPPVERQMNRLAESVQALLRGDSGVSSVGGRSPLASDSTSQNERLRESGTSVWNWRGKQRLVATAALTLFVLFAAGLTAAFWPRTTSSPASGLDGYLVYERRTYTVYPGKMADLDRRFHDHTFGLFEKHGMKVIAYSIRSDKPDTLEYVLAHKNREAAEKSWRDFAADPEWKRVLKETEKHGRMVKTHESQFLSPTDYRAAEALNGRAR